MLHVSGYKDQIAWIQRCLTNTAEDREEDAGMDLTILFHEKTLITQILPILHHRLLIISVTYFQMNARLLGPFSTVDNTPDCWAHLAQSITRQTAGPI